MNLQPQLFDEYIQLDSLREIDFNELYAVASDPFIWEQHPNPDRYKREVFATYFEGALQSKGAFIVRDKYSNEVIGSTRFYDYRPVQAEIKIGYTFYARKCWGSGINAAVKKLMLDYAFQFVDKVIFHVGANNIRSQKAMEKLGAFNMGVEEVAYFGEATRTNVVYVIYKEGLNVEL